MKEFFANKNVNMILGIISVIGIVSFLMRIFGKDEVERKAERSRNLVYLKVRPSYPFYRYKDFADVLDTALLRQATEDEDAVYSIFEEFKNISDVNKTIEAFGTRRQMFSTLYITLPQAIATTFSEKEKKKLNGILESKGIQYVFK